MSDHRKSGSAITISESLTLFPIPDASRHCFVAKETFEWPLPSAEVRGSGPRLYPIWILHLRKYRYFRIMHALNCPPNSIVVISKSVPTPDWSAIGYRNRIFVFYRYSNWTGVGGVKSRLFIESKSSMSFWPARECVNWRDVEIGRISTPSTTHYRVMFLPNEEGGRWIIPNDNVIRWSSLDRMGGTCAKDVTVFYPANNMCLDFPAHSENCILSWRPQQKCPHWSSRYIFIALFWRPDCTQNTIWYLHQLRIKNFSPCHPYL